MSKTDRIERELAALGAEHAPPAGWESRVFEAIGQERIERELARLGEDHKPPVDWQARVRAEIAARPASRRWWQSLYAWWWRIAVPALAAAAAIALFGDFGGSSRPVVATASALKVDVTSQGIVRGVRSFEDPADRAELDATRAGATVDAAARGGPFRALWIYRDERQLVLMCPGDPRCRGHEGELVAQVTLDLVGEYQVVAVASSWPIPPPLGRYARDLAVARRIGTPQEQRIDAR